MGKFWINVGRQSKYHRRRFRIDDQRIIIVWLSGRFLAESGIADINGSIDSGNERPGRNQRDKGPFINKSQELIDKKDGVAQ